MTTMIETRHLTRRFKKTVAVDELNLAIGEGELFGFIGPNGAGKTTTIQMLATLLRPTSGEAFIAGLPLAGRAQEVRRLIGYMPDAPTAYEDLTVREYLEFFAAAYGIHGAERKKVVDEVIALADLGEKVDSLVESLSRGTQQRLGLARVLIHDPQVLLLDEPASGLDPRARIEIREILKELRKLGKTILISSHILSDLAEICTTVGIIERGKLVTSGDVADIIRAARAHHVVTVGLEDRLDEARELLAGCGFVDEVGGDGDDDHRLTVRLRDGEHGPADVARLLVGAGLRLSHLEEATGGLEEAFMTLTKGIVS